MIKGIRLSKKYGVNPTIPKCFFCLKDKNEVLLLGRLKNDEEAPRGAVWDREPCDECKEWMSKGIILISVDEQRSDDMKNPYRTGGWVVVTEFFIEFAVNNPELRDSILKSRVAFLPDQVWDKLRLPRGPVNVEPV